MLGVASTSSSSSFSSSEPSASAKASPPPIPDLVISLAMVITGSELLMISEMPELDVTQYTMEPEETGPHAGTSTGMLLNELIFIFGCESCRLKALGAGDGDAGDAGMTLHQVTQGLSLAEVADQDDEQIINCIEHVCFYGYYFKIPLLLSRLLIFLCSCRLSLCQKTKQLGGW
jgi:hypothetical protein